MTLNVATALGAVLTFFFVKKRGLKFVMILAAVTKIVAWWITGLAHSYWVLLGGISLGCIGVSLNYFTVPMYMGETADKTLRGPLGGWFTISLRLGLIASFYIASVVWFDLLKTSLAMSLFPIAFLLCSYWVPNSPVYLIKRNRSLEAMPVLKSLGKDNVDERISEIKESLDQDGGSRSSAHSKTIRASYLILMLLLCDCGFWTIYGSIGLTCSRKLG